MADPKDKAPDEGAKKKDEKKNEDERRKKTEEGNSTVDMPPAGEIPNAVGPPSRDEEEKITP